MIEILMKDKTFKNYNLYNNVNWVFESRDPLGIGSVIYTVEDPEIRIIVSGEIESSNQMVLVNELLTHFNTELFYHKSIFKELLNKQILYYNIHPRWIVFLCHPCAYIDHKCLCNDCSKTAP